MALHLVVMDWHTRFLLHTFKLFGVGIGDANGTSQLHVVDLLHSAPDILQTVVIVRAREIILYGEEKIEYFYEFLIKYFILEIPIFKVKIFSNFLLNFYSIHFLNFILEINIYFQASWHVDKVKVNVVQLKGLERSANLWFHVLFTVEAPEKLGGHKHVLTFQLAGLEEFLKDLANLRLVLVGPGGVNQAVAILQSNAKSIGNIPFV
jgi:hypothetical protein